MKFELITKYPIEKKIISNFKKIANLIALNENISSNTFFELSIISNQKMAKLNFEYRQKNYSTDVLSFSCWENSEFKTPLLGEIFISYPKAKKQAIEYNHSFEREICFLFTHGVLHLLGYDHIEEKDKKIMFDKQKKIMETLKISR